MAFTKRKASEKVKTYFRGRFYYQDANIKISNCAVNIRRNMVTG